MEAVTKLVIEPDGCLVEPNFHDGLLLGIVLSERHGDLTLLCQEEDGKEYSLVVPKVERLRADNFLQGNYLWNFDPSRNALPARASKMAVRL